MLRHGFVPGRQPAPSDQVRPQQAPPARCAARCWPMHDMPWPASVAGAGWRCIPPQPAWHLLAYTTPVRLLARSAHAELGSRIPEAQVWSYLLQAAHGLHYLHRCCGGEGGRASVCLVCLVCWLPAVAHWVHAFLAWRCRWPAGALACLPACPPACTPASPPPPAHLLACRAPLPPAATARHHASKPAAGVGQRAAQNCRPWGGRRSRQREPAGGALCGLGGPAGVGWAGGRPSPSGRLLAVPAVHDPPATRQPNNPALRPEAINPPIHPPTPASLAPVQAVGTTGFASPEVTAGRTQPASDCFSLGMCLYELCMRRSPFGAASEAAVAAAVQAWGPADAAEAAAALFPDYIPELVGLLQALLQVGPALVAWKASGVLCYGCVVGLCRAARRCVCCAAILSSAAQPWCGLMPPCACLPPLLPRTARPFSPPHGRPDTGETRHAAATGHPAAAACGGCLRAAVGRSGESSRPVRGRPAQRVGGALAVRAQGRAVTRGRLACFAARRRPLALGALAQPLPCLPAVVPVRCRSTREGPTSCRPSSCRPTFRSSTHACRSRAAAAWAAPGRSTRRTRRSRGRHSSSSSGSSSSRRRSRMSSRRSAEEGRAAGAHQTAALRVSGVDC